MTLNYLKDVSIILVYIALMRVNNEVLGATLNSIPMALMVALGPVISKYIYEHYNKKARFLGLIPIVGAVFVSPLTVRNALMIILPAIYAFAFAVKTENDLEYYSFIKAYRILLMAAALIFTINAALLFKASTFIAVVGEHWKENTIAGLGYFVAAFGIACIVARKLRFDHDRVKKESILGIMGIAGVSILIVTFREYLYILIVILGDLVMLPFVFLDVIIPYRENGIKRDNPGQMWHDRMVLMKSGVNPKGDAPISEIMHREIRLDVITNVLMLVITVIILAVVLYKVIKELSIRGRRNNRDEFEDSQVTEPKKIRKIQRFSNREKVRMIYRRFILIMEGRGLKIKESTTSQEILNFLIGKMGYEHAMALRDIYIIARYTSTRI